MVVVVVGGGGGYFDEPPKSEVSVKVTERCSRTWKTLVATTLKSTNLSPRIIQAVVGGRANDDEVNTYPIDTS